MQPKWKTVPEAKARAASVVDVPVSEIMTRNVLTVRPDLSIESLMAVLLERGFSGAPVVNEAGKPVGMVSKTDLVRNRYEDDDQREPIRFAKVQGRTLDLGQGYHTERLATALVGDVMLPIAFTLPEDAPMSQAAALMAYEQVHRIPVVSATGKVVGIVSTIDVLRWVIRQFGHTYAATETRPQAV